jgi:hypothetical protein
VGLSCALKPRVLDLQPIPAPAARYGWFCGRLLSVTLFVPLDVASDFSVPSAPSLDPRMVVRNDHFRSFAWRAGLPLVNQAAHLLDACCIMFGEVAAGLFGLHLSLRLSGQPNLHPRHGRCSPYSGTGRCRQSFGGQLGRKKAPHERLRLPLLVLCVMLLGWPSGCPLRPRG